MNTIVFRTLQVALAVAAALLAGCSSGTTIKSDLVLAGYGSARIDLHQKTDAIDLVNNSGVAVRIRVLGKKDRIMSNMLLSGHDQVRLDILTARAIEFDNDNGEQAMIRWTLRNHDRIEYTMALNP
ncbi:MAG: hypothetical protein IID28_14170 [Planctomycetes bacterium]|nr:hypothetical protein [Planctomycetota bacterium]